MRENNFEWIDAEFNLPEVDEAYLVAYTSDLNKIPFVCVCEWCESYGGWCIDDTPIAKYKRFNAKITAWAELPAPPRF